MTSGPYLLTIFFRSGDRFAKRKNIHLLWVSRDGGMVALFEKQVSTCNNTTDLTPPIGIVLVQPRLGATAQHSDDVLGGASPSSAAPRVNKVQGFLFAQISLEIIIGLMSR